MKKLEEGASEDYTLKRDILYKFEEGKDLLLIPKKLQNEIIRKCHEFGHFGIKKTKELVIVNIIYQS